MNDKLLLQASTIFDGADTYDCLLQSIIDLNSESKRDDVFQILENSQKILKYDHETNFTYDLFSLILKCYSLFPKDFIPIFGELMKKSKENFNYTFATVLIISFYVENDYSQYLPQYNQFINDAFIEIQNFKENQISVFKHKIPSRFKMDFLLNLAISSEFTGNLKNLLIYLLNQKNLKFFVSNTNKISFLVHKIIHSNHMDLITSHFPDNKSFYPLLNIDDLSIIIPLMPVRIFKKNLFQFEQILQKSLYANLKYITALFQRCDKLNIKLKSIESAFNFLKEREITPQISKYFKKYDFNLPNQAIKIISDHPDRQFVLDKMINENLLDINDINFFEVLFELNNFTSPTLSTSNFYLHIFSVFYQNKGKTTTNFIRNIAKNFQKFISKEHFIKSIDDIIYGAFNSDQNLLETISCFINVLDIEYQRLFYEKKHMMNYINTIMKMAKVSIVLPISLIQFIDKFVVYKIISKNILLNQEISMNLYYLYKFSNKNIKINKNIDFIMNININKIQEFQYRLNYRVLKPNNFSIFFINFIKTNNFSLLSLIENDSLIFILQALIFTEDERCIIRGLTKETVLPFYAIVLNNWKKNCNSYIFDNENNTNLFLNALRTVNNYQSLTIIESFKVILHSLFIRKSIYQITDIKTKMLDILIESLLEHKCDLYKKIIISCITSNINQLKFVKSNVNNLIKYILKEANLENMIFIDKFVERYQYFKNSQQLFKVPLIYFEDSLINFIPLIEYKFLNEDIENNISIVSFIFSKMMKNKLLRRGYLITHLQMIDENQLINKNYLFDLISSDFSLFVADLKDIFNYVYMNHNRSFNFIKRLHFKDNDFFKSDFEVGRHIIHYFLRLIKKKKWKFQAFYCLKIIANSFQFIFDSDPYQIFKIVLPELNKYSIFFNESIKKDDKIIEQKAKTAICALSLLVSLLHSNKIMDIFLNWYFTNFEMFSIIQNFCFNHIFYSILKIDGLKRVFVASLLKHNYYAILLKLMKKDIHNDLLRDNYNTLLFKLLYEYINSFYNFDQVDIIAIDELQKMDFPFVHEFNNFNTFLPLKIHSITSKSFKKVPTNEINKELFQFMEKIEKALPVNLIIYNGFERRNFLKETYEPNVDVDYYSYVYRELPVTACRIIFQQSAWMYQWITRNSKSPLCPDEYEMINQALEEIDQNFNNYQHDPLLTEFDTSEYFSQYYSEKNFFNIRNYNSISNYEFINFCKLFNIILCRKKDPISLLNLLARNFDIIENDSMKGEDLSNYINRFLSILVEISKNESFKQNFRDIFEIKLYDLVLQPQYRTDAKILSKWADIINNVNLKEISLSYNLIFNFMFLTKNNDVIFKAIKLIDIYFEINPSKHIKMIKKLIKYYLIKEEIPISKIVYLIKLLPSFDKFELNFVNLFDKLFRIDFINDDNIKEIVKLFNYFTPDKSEYISKIVSNIQQITNDQDPPIPSQLIQTNPLFWNWVIENRLKINKMIEEYQLTFFNDNYILNGDNSMISMKLFDEYPQLFSFNFRYKLFYNKMSKEIQLENINYLIIDRENILESSYDQLHKLSQKGWKNEIRIKYIDEEGYDLGGLRRDWFIKLSEALFNTDLGLFSISENMSYQPSIQSYANPNHLNLFEFAGYFVARALIQGEHIDGHFTHAFLCNILHQKVYLKDIEEIDQSIYNSLCFILNYDLDEFDLDLYFSVDHDNFGIIKSYDFIENGSQVKVTNENKSKYINYMINYHVRNSIETQYNKFYDGFDSLIPFDYIKIFNTSELDMMISGVSIIDVENMKKYTVYEYPLSSNSPSVVLFFNSIVKWDQKSLRKLLKFITGSSKVPANGFYHYKNIGKPITIQSGGEKFRLPQAHTCFNILALPFYENERELNMKFEQALTDDCFNLE